MTKSSLGLLLVATFSAAAGQVLFKVGARGQEKLLEFLNAPIFGGLILYLLGTAIWIFVLSKEKLTDVYAFTALTFVLVYLAGVFFLQERVGLVTLAGVVLVLLGLYLIVAQPGMGK